MRQEKMASSVQLDKFSFRNGRPSMRWIACLAFGLSCLITSAAWGQAAPSIKTGCNGAMNTPMAQIAAPYQRALAALNGSEVGWCAIASESTANSPMEASFWEFSSAAFVFHALRGRKELTPIQLTAMRELLAQIPGIGNPPTQVKQIDNALYGHMRALAAQDSGYAMVSIDTIEQYSPAVYRTLIRRSIRWGRWGDTNNN